MKAATQACCLLVGALVMLLIVGTNGPSVDADTPSVEKRLEQLEERVAKVESILPVLARWEKSVRAMLAEPSVRKRAEDKRRLGMLTFDLQTYDEIPMKNGAVDVYRLWRDEHLTDDLDIDLSASARTGVGPTPQERAADNYDFFPYHRFRGAKPPKKDAETPLLWDKRVGPDKIRLVAFANGFVKEVSDEELDRILKAAKQD
ncbi:MAG: hypothetical protein V3T86_03880 [Planctomycetota bacterium]